MPAPRPPRAGTVRPREIGKRANQLTLEPLLAAEAEHFSVVGIGASAGGLEACRGFVSALQSGTGMVCILIQHLDPAQPSLMVELIASHTTLAVLQVVDGMRIEREHIYIIPPGFYLSVVDRVLHLSLPDVRHGARLPFDFLLNSMASEFGRRAVCVVLSGTGADGSVGLKAIKDQAGLVIVQHPEEAAFDGMVRSAIATGAVDLILPVAEIAAAIAKHELTRALSVLSGSSVGPLSFPTWLPKIIELLRARTVHDFRFYKYGTLLRRVERRMALASIAIGDGERYLEVLAGNQDELELLGKDLLINVTSFFRDAGVFELLENTIAPGLVGNQNPELPLRIWVAGCSTGEEVYSLIPMPLVPAPLI